MALTTVRGSVWDSIENLFYLNLRDFGAVGDGSTDDTAAIDEAFAALDNLAGQDGVQVNGARDIVSRAGAGALYVPPGEYVYNGSGYVPTLNKNIVVYGAGPSSSVFQIQSDVWLIEATDASLVMNSIDLRDIKTNGGKGLFMNNKTNLTGVGDGVKVERCQAVGFTVCGFGSITDEQDKWELNACLFEAGNSGNRIGVCLPRQVAVINLVGNTFIGCKYSIKLNGGGHSLYNIGPNNSFFTHSANSGVKLADIWAVPDDVDPNAGFNFSIFRNRFSNENKGTEPKILIAEEDTTNPVIIERPNSTNISSKPFWGFKITGNSFQGTGNPSSGASNSGVIKTFTPKAGYIKFKDNSVTQWYPFIVEFASGITDIDEGFWGSCDIDVPKQGTFTNLYTVPISNQNIGLISREPGLYLGSPGEVFMGGANDPGYVSLSLGQRTDNNLKGAAVTVTTETDAVGGQNAAEFTYGADQIVAVDLVKAAIIPGRIIWFEFDIKKSSTNPLDYIQFEVDFGESVDYSWTLELTPEWKRLRVPIMFNNDLTGVPTFQARWAPRLHLNVGVKNRFLVGREAVYHANAPMNYEPLEVKQSRWDQGRLILGDFHIWVDTFGKLRIKDGAPASDTDGTIVGTQTA